LLLPRSYLTAAGGDLDFSAGENHFGGTFMFFWDTSFVVTLLSLLDPVIVKQDFERTLAVNFRQYFGFDMFSGKPNGYYYGASSKSIYTMLSTYIKVTNDTAFLKEIYRSRSVLDWMTSLALDWQGFPSTAPSLTNYGGDPNNFLEAVPSYRYTVPFLNAANVWMMEEVADYVQKFGNNQTLVAYLKKQSTSTAQAILQRLYFKGKGYFGCLYDNGTLVQVRHVIDFHSVTRYMPTYISQSMQSEMIQFLDAELITPGWMRALSTKDPVAPIGRPDHGSNGAYDAWPALTVSGLTKIMNFPKALDFLTQTEIVTHEGPYGQAHQVMLGSQTVPPFKTLYGVTRYTAICGGAWAETILNDFFGFSPSIQGTILQNPTVSRGFIGTLQNLKLYDGIYTIESGSSGLTLKKN